MYPHHLAHFDDSFGGHRRLTSPQKLCAFKLISREEGNICLCICLARAELACFFPWVCVVTGVRPRIANKSDETLLKCERQKRQRKRIRNVNVPRVDTVNECPFDVLMHWANIPSTNMCLLHILLTAIVHCPLKRRRAPTATPHTIKNNYK